MDVAIEVPEPPENGSNLETMVDVAQDAQEALDTAEAAEETADEALAVAEIAAAEGIEKWQLSQDQWESLERRVTALETQPGVVPEVIPEPEAAEISELSEIGAIEEPETVEAAVVETAPPQPEKRSHRIPESRRLFG